MKLFATVSFLMTIVSLVTIAFAQVTYYGIDTRLHEDGLAAVTLTITFKQPVDSFSTIIIGRIDNFEANSNSGPVDCNISVKGTSVVNCNLNLTGDKRTLFLNFNTNDFVKQLDEKFFFSNDFSIDADVDSVFASLRLPDRMVLTEEAGKISLPEYADVVSEGNVIVWSISNINKDSSIKLEALYQRLPTPFFEQLRIRYIIIFAVVTGAVIAFLILRHYRKSEQLVLSVLDDFERKVIDVISNNQGEVNQRKVVQETNLSKAKVSRVVKSLVGRGLIEAQRIGRTNKLKLIKKKLVA